MNDLPRHTLARIIAEDGREICAAPKRVEALLRDLCGAHRREINIIVGALEERVAADLMAAGKSTPKEALLARLAARLRDNLAYTPEAARWGVETWAFALGILSEAELQERARKDSAEADRSEATPPVGAPKPSPPSSASSSPQEDSRPQRGTTYAPPRKQPQQQPLPPQRPQPPQQQPQQPQTPHTRAQTQPVTRQPAPVPRRTPTVQPNIIVPPPQDVSPLPAPQRSRRGLTLRGCFIGVLLIIVLIVAAVFVVPAVVMVLKEEQAQPSINDPRIK